MAVSATPLHEHFGVEVRGVDLSDERDESLTNELKDLVYENGLLVFRHQQLSSEDLIRLTAPFGELMKRVISTFLDDQPAMADEPPEILVISNIFENGQPIALYDGDATEWHSDGSYNAQPTTVAVLYCIEAAAEGGDTLFASAEAAYAALPPAVKQRIDGLQAVHSLAHMTMQEQKLNPHKPDLTEKQKRESPDVVHPLVRTHPITGRKSLTLGQMAIKGIVGWPQVESDEVLDELLNHHTQPQFLYRHKWQVGDVVCWDNRSLLHTVTPCDRTKNRRLLHRTSVLD